MKLSDVTRVASPKESATEQDQLRQSLRKAYGDVARADDAGESCGNAAGCCGTSDDVAVSQLISTRLGYSERDQAQVPQLFPEA